MGEKTIINPKNSVGTKLLVPKCTIFQIRYRIYTTRRYHMTTRLLEIILVQLSLLPRVQDYRGPGV